MFKFEVGKVYSMRSVCDQNCIWSYEVIARTAKMVTLKQKDKYEHIQKCRISEWGNSEICKPLGSYSMCPILSAEVI